MNKGFFCDDDIPQALKRGDEKAKKIKIQKKIGCEACGLHHSCNSPKLGIQGKGEKSILIIVNSPGKNDDETGKYLSGNSGKKIREIIEQYGISIKNDCWIMGARQCHAVKPKPAQEKACAYKIQEAIAELKPRVILTLGDNAIDAVVNHKLTGRLSGIALKDWVGTCIPDQEFKAFICPTWDGSYLYTDRDEENPVVYSQMCTHIFQAIKHCTEKVKEVDYFSKCQAITDLDEAFELLHDTLQFKEVLAMDYETTGAKPHRNGHKIFSCALSDGQRAYAFPFFNDEMFRKEWKKIMQSTNTKKILHNAKFEWTWTKHRAGMNNTAGYEIKNICADTMLDAHIIHNRKKVNLKFNTYVNFGIAGYDDAIDEYIVPSQEAKEKDGANAFNTIEEAPLNELLKYNAADALFTYALWEIQQPQLIKNITRRGSEFFLDSSLALAKAEETGLLLDVEGAKIQYAKLTKKMERLEYAISISDDMKKWDKEKPFRPSAPGDLTHLLFNCLGFKPDKDNCTPTGKPKADAEAVACFDNDTAKDTLKWRKLKKVRDTYLNGFLKEEANGIIHTSLNLHTVDTFRSSSNDPNLQNVPARDAEIMKLLKTLLIARPGHKLGEYDYKAMEAVVIACYNKDPNWIRYVSDASTDMHRDMASKLFIRDKKDVLKSERQCGKNGFVFPTVYGSYWKNTATNLWNDCEQVTKDHLKSEGIKNLDDMRSHVKSVEKWFWEDQFPVGHEWMNKTIKEYEQKGYIDLLTGFRCYGPMTRNQIINYRVQGTASHCKLWTLNKLSKLIEKKKMNSRIMLEIHDSILPDIDPAEENYLDYQIWLYGTQKIREYWDWLIVPLFLEKKISKLNGNWAEMENLGLLNGECSL